MNECRRRLREMGRQYAVAAMVACLGAGTSCLLYCSFGRQERARTEVAFARIAAGRVEALRDRIEEGLLMLRALGSFYSASEDVDRDEFGRFVRPFLSWQKSVQALGWIPRVPDEQRRRYEAEAQRDGLQGFHFTEIAGPRQLIEASPRAEHFPIYFVEPIIGNERALGLDLASNPVRRRALEHARDSGEAEATGPITVVQESGGQLGFLIFAPVYRTGAAIDTVAQRRENLRGFVLATFRVGDFVEGSYRRLAPPEMDMHLFDNSDPARPEHLFSHWSSPRTTATKSTMPQATDMASDFRVDAPLKVAGRRWSVVCVPTPGAIRASQTWYPMMALLGGLLGTALLTKYLMTAKRQTFRAHCLSQRLLASNRALEAENAHRRKAEDMLRSRLAAIDAAADMVMITDVRGRIEYVNPAFTATTGYEAAEVLGETPHVLNSRAQDAQFYRGMWQQILGGRVWRGELTNRRKDGGLYPEEMTITPIRDAAGAVSRFVAIKRDVTARREYEALERERSSLKAAVAAMEQVLGIVGHELRSPLASIRALAEVLLIDQVTADEQTFFMKSIHDEVVRMSGTINDLLEAARINSGHARWNWSEVDVAQVCREAADGTAPLLDPGSVSLQVAVEPPEVSMRGDPDAVRRLVVNLLSNSVKHTASGSISVKACAAEQEGRSWVRIEVADTGSGISPELVRYLGEAFTLNAGVVGSKHVQGTGLGLSICRGIAAAHGGWMSVQSTPGAGTTMTAMLRADLDEPARTETPIRLMTSDLAATAGEAA